MDAAGELAKLLERLHQLFARCFEQFLRPRRALGDLILGEAERE